MTACQSNNNNNNERTSASVALLPSFSSATPTMAVQMVHETLRGLGWALHTK